MRYSLFIIGCLVFCLSGCPSGPDQGNHSDPQPAPTPQPSSPPEQGSTTDRLKERGAHIVQVMQQNLSALLIKHLRDQGPARTVKYCSVHALPLTDSLARTFGVSIQRVTHRPRQPQNKANAKELRLIREYIQQLDKEKPLQPRLQEQADGSHIYFSPIVIKNSMCLNCHGQPEVDIQPRTLAAIQQAYPKDSAKGFGLNELRGMWRIDFSK